MESRNRRSQPADAGKGHTYRINRINYKVEVRLDGQAWQEVDVRSLHRHRDDLLAARKRGDSCRCKCRESLRLVIRLYTDQEQQRERKVGLAVYPGTGHLHEKACWFFREQTEANGRKGYTESVIREDKEGNLHVLTEWPLHRKGVLNGAKQDGQMEVCTARRPGTPARRRPRMTLLGLLHLLWEEAKLHHWHPDRTRAPVHERWWPVVWRLWDAATRIRIAQTRMGDALVVLTPHPGRKDREQAERVLDPFLDKTTRNNRRVMLLGEVEKLDLKPRTVLLRLKWDTEYKVWLHVLPKDYGQLEPQCKASEGERAIALCLGEVEEVVDVPNGPFLSITLRDVAVMRTTEDFIPVASSYEKRVALELVRQQRHFIKPLRYDAEKDAVFPDFVLLDVPGGEYAMEVYGRTDEAYQIRREEKEKFYAEHFPARYWRWVAAGEGATPNPPPFPE